MLRNLSSVFLSAVLLPLVVGCGDGAALPPHREGMELRPLIASAASSTSTSSSSGMAFHGGSVMTSAVKVYYIWYGDWTGSSGPTILNALADGLSNSGYFHINNSYANGSGSHPVNLVSLGGSATDNYSQGKSLTSDQAVAAIVKKAITGGKLPANSNGVYFVLTSPDVTESGFCSSYCGWHASTTISSTSIKFAFVGNASTQCASSCIEQTKSSPNGDPGVDGMADVIAHELAEAVTDPNGDSWYSSSGDENADICAWNFGTTFSAANGSSANATIGGRQFLLQQNWVKAASGGYCAMTAAIPFNKGSNQMTNMTGDWDPNFYKGECDSNEAATGLSKSPNTTFTHAVFCQSDGNRYPHTGCSTRNFGAGDNRGTTSTGDWAVGSYKGECDTDEYVAGVSQGTDGKIHSILCCTGTVTHKSCAGLNISAGDNRESSVTGDWDFAYYKGECSPGRYLAGVSRQTSNGAPHDILCCSP